MGVPRFLRAYVAAVVLAGAALIPTLDWDIGGGDGMTALLLAALAALVGARPVRIAALKTDFVPTHPFVLCALAALGPAPAVLVALAGIAGMLAVRHRALSLMKGSFNVGAVALSSVAASHAYALTGGTAGGSLVARLGPLVAATAAYFLTNSGLVAGAVAVEKREPYLETWRQAFGWSAATYFAGLTLAVVLVMVLEGIGPWALALGVPPCWLLAGFYRMYRERLEEQRRRLEEAVNLNAELERMVQARTQELAEANRRLQETNERLIEANRAKSEFLANVSHELRTPLNAIIGFSELLRDPQFGLLGDRQTEFLMDIQDSGEHLLNLINDILDLSKIEAGRMEVHLQSVDVLQLLREAAAMLRHQAAKKGLELQLGGASQVGTAELDPGMFRQIVLNLLSNAVKFTGPGGRVDAVARAEGRDLVVEVADTGIGIAKDDQEKIFQEFYQADGSYSRKYQGTGLGLALVRRMLAMHGGAVSLTSAPGQGSRFTCRFPEAIREAALAEVAVPVAPAVAASAPARRTILLVEDNALNRKLARNALRSRGYDVVEAESGEEALAVVHQCRPDLVLMDLQLPGMDGLETTRRLKGDPATSAIQVVALTAHAQRLDQARAREAGCAGYITKPIRLARFASEIEPYFAPQEGAA